MVSRRTALHLAAGALVTLAGCSNREDSTDTPSDARTPTNSASPTDSRTPTDSPSPTRDRPTNWNSEWVRTLSTESVLGVDLYDKGLYLTLELAENRAAVAEAAPTDGRIRWRKEFEGAPIDGSSIESTEDDIGWRSENAGGLGVTETDDSVYLVTGNDADGGWTTLHTLDRNDGHERWRVREQDRLQDVRLLTDDTVVVASDEIPPPSSAERPPKPTPGRVRGFAIADGTTRWTVSFDPLDRLFTGRRGVYALSETELVALAPDGRERWRLDTGRPVQEMVDTGDRIYHVTNTNSGGGLIRGLDPNGDVAWSRQITVDDTIPGPNGQLLVCGARTLSLARDGRIVWEDLLDSTRPVIGPAGETIYVRAGGEAVVAYSLPEGRRLWEYDPPERYAWPNAATPEVALVEGYVENTALYAIPREEATATKRFELRDLNNVFDVETVDGYFYIGDGRGRLVKLDPRLESM